MNPYLFDPMQRHDMAAFRRLPRQSRLPEPGAGAAAAGIGGLRAVRRRVIPSWLRASARPWRQAVEAMSTTASWRARRGRRGRGVVAAQARCCAGQACRS